MSVSERQLTAKQLWPHLQGCGYQSSNALRDLSLSGSRVAALAGFAQRPFDTRSACFVAMDVTTQPNQDAFACRSVGAPITFLCHENRLLWWKQTESGPSEFEQVPANHLDGFFQEHKADFHPQTVYRAKTLGRFDKMYQRTFVDLGLMPLVEKETGQAIEQLLLRSVARLRDLLSWPKQVDLAQGQWLVKSVFWLLGAKMLHDKEVEGFVRLNFRDVDNVFERVANHYGESAESLATNRAKRSALEEIASDIESGIDLRLATTEALGYVYENTLISDEIRKEFGTHSTPSYLVDYIVGRLSPWIEDIEQDKRSVFEPACGHGAFLISAIRFLTSILPPNMAEPATRKKYLRERVRGYDVDDFAVEIARLSLTLTDIPNPNGWQLKSCDLFQSDLLEAAAKQSTIILANPPFEDFKDVQRETYEKAFRKPASNNKATEILYRALSVLPEKGVFGVVVPLNLLHSHDAIALRKLLVTKFEFDEVCVFPDRVFNFAKQESAVLIGRKIPSGKQAKHSMFYRRVRVHGMEAFKQSYAVTSEAEIQQTRFSITNDWDLRIPDLERVWKECSTLPTFDQFAEIGNGFIHLGKKHPKLPSGTSLVSDKKFPGAVKGFVRFDHRIQIHGLPRECWVRIDPAVIFRRRSGVASGLAQVLLNFAPIQMAPWCLKALRDKEGRPVNSRFLTVRPRDSALALDVLWALCNSPFVNAYAYTHSTKREILAGTLRRMPVPDLSKRESLRILSQAVRDYFKAVSQYEAPLPLRGDDVRADEAAKLRDLHWRVDAEVLRLYSLPAELERELLDYFAGWKRAGVPYEQDRYFPAGFDDEISLADFLAIAADWDITNKRRLNLIQKKAAKRISPEEGEELQRLQKLAGIKSCLVMPPPLKELSEIEENLRRRGLWRGA